MKADTVWHWLSRAMLVLLVAAAVLLVRVSYVPLIRTNANLGAENLRLLASIQAEEQKARRLEAYYRALRYDPRTIERLAREKLGLARPGETVVHFEPARTRTFSP